MQDHRSHFIKEDQDQMGKFGVPSCTFVHQQSVSKRYVTVTEILLASRLRTNKQKSLEEERGQELAVVVGAQRARAPAKTARRPHFFVPTKKKQTKKNHPLASTESNQLRITERLVHTMTRKKYLSRKATEVTGLVLPKTVPITTPNKHGEFSSSWGRSVHRGDPT